MTNENSSIHSTVDSGCCHNSHIFNASTGINSLITAATPLFSIAGRLRTDSNFENHNQLLENLADEIQVFIYKARQSGYDAYTISIGCQALCCLLDELITKTAWSRTNNWQAGALLAKSNNHATDNQETFFTILNRIHQSLITLQQNVAKPDNPANKHEQFDLLEFIYICLTLGFAGQHPNIENDLYTHINRIHTETEFNNDYEPEAAQTNDTNIDPQGKFWHKYKIVGLYIITILLINSALYIGLNLQLNATANSIKTTIKRNLQPLSGTSS